jgi:uncharacterized membrane protein
MLAGHFPQTYGHRHAWAVLVALMVVGAWIRVFFNLRHAGRTLWEIPLTAALAIAAIAVWIRPEASAAPTQAVSFQEARQIVNRRCVSCHSGSTAPAGVRLDDDDVLRARAGDVAQLVRAKAMPPGNATGITQDERDRLVAWAASAGR